MNRFALQYKATLHRSSLKMRLGLLLPGLLTLNFLSTSAFGYTTSKAWVEVLPSGIYRVHVAYTVPELKEKRQAMVEFFDQKAANVYYLDLIRGADFTLPSPENRQFKAPKKIPRPW